MGRHQIMGIAMMAMLLVYLAVELGWGGGVREHPDHNRPPWNLW